MMEQLISVVDIINFLRSEVIYVHGDISDAFIQHLRPQELVDEDTLDWISSKKTNKQQYIEQSKAKAVICDSSINYSDSLIHQNKVLIKVKNPRLAIGMVSYHYFVKKPAFGIDPSASLNPDTKLSGSVFIGSHCSIGDCIIGEGTYIYPNVTIYDGVTIGKNVIIHAGTVIGADGLGCERREDNSLFKFPHLGGVLIGNDVEIGANSIIARGSLSDTVIGNGSKLNGLCFIAHNCVLGENVWISLNTTIAGSVKVANNVTIFSKVMIREQLIIGEGSTIGMGSVVTKNIPSGEIWYGCPAKKVVK